MDSRFHGNDTRIQILRHSAFDCCHSAFLASKQPYICAAQPDFSAFRPKYAEFRAIFCYSHPCKHQRPDSRVDRQALQSVDALNPSGLAKDKK
jgi:hypothetical protein